jgi:hypothetical protein
MQISADDSAMQWTTSLTNIDQLQQELGMIQPITALNYHLHQQWTTDNADYGVGADACNAMVTGGHYDPYFGCGPATGVPADHCAFIGKNTSTYTCSPEVYASGLYAECEVGDFSGKYGPIPVVVVNGDRDGTTTRSVAVNAVPFDPLPALDSHYQDDRIPSPADGFASIVFHDGSPRVLCGKIMAGKLPRHNQYSVEGPATPPVSASSRRHGCRWLLDGTTTMILLVLTWMW